MNDDAISRPLRLQVGSRLLVRYFGIALLIPAVSIVFHELGHFGAHAALGYEVNRLSYAATSVGSPPAGVDARLAGGLSFAAGTAVSLLLMGLGVLSIVAMGPNPVGLGLVMFECVRAAVSLAVTIGTAGWVAALTGASGELRYLAVALGDPPLLGVTLALIEVALPFVALVFVLRRFASGTRLYTSIVVLAGVLGGLALWLLVVGPRLLPA